MKHPSTLPTGDESAWYLEGFNAQGAHWQIPIHSFPFRVGRLRANDLCLSFSGISRRHAEIIQLDDILWVRECGSTNGTFVNRERVNGQMRLSDGDIIHFGLLEFRLRNQFGVGDESESTQALRPSTALSESLGDEQTEIFANRMTALLSERSITTKFQPIIHLQKNRPAGYELLGRGRHPGLPTKPYELFAIATLVGSPIELSDLFRNQGIQHALELGLQLPVFINTVPEEIENGGMSRTLTELRKHSSELPLVLEIHEKSLTSLTTMRELQALLKDLEIELAYDDFGAGQARLVELIEVPPDWLKFDISLIRNIHRQPPRAVQVLRTLVHMARDLGIKTIAEGIEVAAEKLCCEAIGFEYGQGFYLSRPSAKPVRPH